MTNPKLTTYSMRKNGKHFLYHQEQDKDAHYFYSVFSSHSNQTRQSIKGIQIGKEEKTVTVST